MVAAVRGEIARTAGAEEGLGPVARTGDEAGGETWGLGACARRNVAAVRELTQATAEAIVNALVAARDMNGTEGRYAKALPHAELVALLKRYNRYSPPPH